MILAILSINDYGQGIFISRPNNPWTNTAQKMKFSVKEFFSKCEQIRSFLRIKSLLLKKFLMENLIFCAV